MTEWILAFVGGILLLLYIFKISGYAIALLKAPLPDSVPLVSEHLKVSLLIPFRNEAEHLPYLILDTQIQLYPSDKFEVIFIDDHSDDESVSIIERLAKDVDNIKMIQLPDHLKGKKEAILKGVNEASGDWMIQTDADCRIPRGFIREHVRLALEDRNSFIAGPVLLRESKDIWNQMEVLEHMSLTGSTVGSFLTKKPVMCNGANLSYSKEFYLRSIAELSRINSPSGDDIFLLIRAKKEGLQTKYLMSEHAVVTTDSSGSPWAFLQQRIRWGSKAKYYKDKDMVSLALLVWLSNAFVLSALIIGIIDFSLIHIFAFSLLAKSLADLFILIATVRQYNKFKLLWYFPLMALFYYFYLVITGVLAVLLGFKWKGRKYK